jgi:hypothetical protein
MSKSKILSIPHAQDATYWSLPVTLRQASRLAPWQLLLRPLPSWGATLHWGFVPQLAPELP